MAIRRAARFRLDLVVAMALVAAACTGVGQEESSGEQSKPVRGGTLVFGAEQEPSESLNGLLACCNLYWQSVIFNQVLEGAFEVTPDFAYVPNIIEDDPEITQDPFTLTYKIRDEAEWNDGTPISAQDFLFTAQTIVDPQVDAASRAGYDQIDLAATEIIDPKTVRFTFEKPYAGWHDLFNPVLPKHALQGENFDKVWTNEVVDPKTGEPIASGPFQFESYNKGSDLTLARNKNYWGEHPAYLDEIVFRFMEETTTEIQALRGGEVDAINPQPQLELAELTEIPTLEVQTNAGTIWEHLNFQFNDPLLQQRSVRQAIGYGIDREAIVDQLFKDIAPDLEALHNMIWLSNSEFYAPHYNMYERDVAKATRLLEDNGCTKGDDGIYLCDGRRLSFGFASTAGNALRELVFEIVQEQLKDVGIEVTSEFGDAAVFVEDLDAAQYEIAMYAWFGSPDPAYTVEIFRCNGDQNSQNYCNERVTRLLQKSDVTVDPEERASLMNQAVDVMAQDIPVIPLYQKPTFFAYSEDLQNAQDNPTGEGPTWNSEDWWLRQ